MLKLAEYNAFDEYEGLSAMLSRGNSNIRRQERKLPFNKMKKDLIHIWILAQIG